MKVRRSVNYCREVAENPKKSKGRQSDQAAARSNLNGSSVRGGRLPTTRHTFTDRVNYTAKVLPCQNVRRELGPVKTNRRLENPVSQVIVFLG